MGVGKTVYKGEVETGVFAWFFATAQAMPVCKELHNPCRSEPARDGGVSDDAYVDGHTAIASRLTPTGCIAQKLTQFDDE